MDPHTIARLTAAREHVVQGRIQEAEVELNSILAQDSDNLAAQMLLGVAHFKSGDLERADRLLTKVILVEPRQADAISFLAFVRKARKDLSGAIELYQSLIKLGIRSVDLYNQLGTCWLELGDAIAAGSAFKQAIELDRAVAHSYYNLGLALKLAGRSFETFMTFKRSAELDPDFFDNYVQLWQQMRQLLNWQEGLPYLETGLKRHPKSTQMKVMVAATYGKVGRLKDAENLFKSAIHLDSAAAPPYAHWLQEEGRFEESVPILKLAIESEPIQGQAYYNLAIAKCFEVNGCRLTDIAPPLLSEEKVNGEGRMFLYYALAKTYEHDKDYENAMRNYDLANDCAYHLYNSQYDYDTFAVEHERRILESLYTKDTISNLRLHGSQSTVPIFIVGMIRTGTTLLDQILSSHPEVRSAGEQPFWQVSAGRVNRKWTDFGHDVAEIRDLEKRYLDVLWEASQGAAKVTDKMPTNFYHMGLMSIIFPKAKFIHIRRNPLDTCVSIYTTFLGSGTQFAYKQENIVAYYREYLRAMEFWRTVIPAEQMIEIDYEDLVINKELVLRDLLNFCDLAWDNAVLAHEQNTSQVSTPSLWTVRQPVNAASVERWRKYEPWLGKLLELKDVTHPVPIRGH